MFGGIEELSRKNFMVAIIPIIEKYTLPGTTIISDCWKPYDILKDIDYLHLKVINISVTPQFAPLILKRPKSKAI